MGKYKGYDPRYNGTRMRLDAQYRYRFGIDFAEYERMLEEQGGVCRICAAPPSVKTGKRLPVDHCHRSGRVRGILCDDCNQGIGRFKDSPELMQRAIEYLERVS